MTIDPLSIAWDHAYYTEGPVFVGKGYSNGGSVSNFPDEMGAAVPSAGWSVGSIRTKPAVAGTGVDLTQSTSGQQPLYRSAQAGFNSQPCLEFDGTDDLMTTASFTGINMPFYLYMVARWRGGSTADAQWFVTTSNDTAPPFAPVSIQGLNQGHPNPGNWYISGNNGFAFTATAATTGPHAMRATLDGTPNEANWLDEVSLFSGGASNIGSGACSGLTIGGRSDAIRIAACDIAFLGIKASALTSTEISDLHAWSQAHFNSP